MDCPRCGSELKGENYKGIEVDKCVGCEGMWLDYSELDQLEDTVMDADEFKGSMVTRPAEGELPCPRNPAEKPCCDEMRWRITSGLGQV